MTDLLKGLGGVSDVGVMGGAGEDGGVFLHSQLTQDFSSLDMRQARLAAFLSAKGRMQASFIGLRRPDEWLLLCSRDLLPATLARLALFVLRAQAPPTHPHPTPPPPPLSTQPPAAPGPAVLARQVLIAGRGGGVSSKKGGHPGQGGGPRSQFRGTLKRRAYIAH